MAKITQSSFMVVRMINTSGAFPRRLSHFPLYGIGRKCSECRLGIPLSHYQTTFPLQGSIHIEA